MLNKQDILNAFDKKFCYHDDGVLELDHDIYQRLPEIREWLLNALTEFERGTKERIKLCAKEQSCSMCMESLSQLEKEKRT